MIKKIVCLLLCALLGFSACACGDTSVPPLTELKKNNISWGSDRQIYLIEIFNNGVVSTKENSSYCIVGLTDYIPFGEDGVARLSYEQFPDMTINYTVRVKYEDLTFDMRIRRGDYRLFWLDDELSKRYFIELYGYDPDNPTPPDDSDPTGPDAPADPTDPSEPSEPEFAWNSADLAYDAPLNAELSSSKGQKYTFTLSETAHIAFALQADKDLTCTLTDVAHPDVPLIQSAESFDKLLPAGNYSLALKAAEQAVATLTCTRTDAVTASDNSAQVEFKKDRPFELIRFTPSPAGNYLITLPTNAACTVYDEALNVLQEYTPANRHSYKFENSACHYLLLERTSANTSHPGKVTFKKVSDAANADPDFPESISLDSFTANIDADDTTLYYKLTLSSQTLLQVTAGKDAAAGKTPSVNVMQDGSTKLSVYSGTSDMAFAAGMLSAGEYTVAVRGDKGTYTIGLSDPRNSAQYVSYNSKFRLSSSGSTTIKWFRFSFRNGTKNSDKGIVYLKSDENNIAAFYTTNMYGRPRFKVHIFDTSGGWTDSSGSPLFSSKFSLYNYSYNTTGDIHRAGDFGGGSRYPMKEGATYYFAVVIEQGVNGSEYFWLSDSYDN